MRRKLDGDARAAARRALHQDSAVVGLHNPLDRGKPEPVPRDFVVKNAVKILSRTS